MSKTVKHCVVCQENFGERFGFCPVCGSPLKTVETGQNEAFAAASARESMQQAAPQQEFVPAAAATPLINESTVFTRNAPESANGSAKYQVNQPVVSAPENGHAQPSDFQADVFSSSNDNFAASHNDGLYHLTILDDQGLLGRLSAEFADVAHQSQLTYPEFKRDPIGFTGRAAKGYSQAAAKTMNEPNILFGTLGGFALIFVAIIGLWLYDIYSVNLNVDPIEEGIVGIVYPQDVRPVQEEEEPVRKNSEKGGGGGGGGREEEKQASYGREVAQTREPIMQTPNVNIPKRDKPEIEIRQFTEGNQKEKPEDSHLPAGIKSSLNLDPSNGTGSGGGLGEGRGTGQGGGIGTGKGNGRGSGSGNGDGNGNGDGTGDGDNAPVPPKAVPSEPLKILAQPRPNYTEEARKQNVQGVVRLRVTFSASGQVTGISPVGGLPYGLTEQAIAAARLMKFSPAKKNGVPVSVSKVVEYRFSIY